MVVVHTDSRFFIISMCFEICYFSGRTNYKQKVLRGQKKTVSKHFIDPPLELDSSLAALVPTYMLALYTVVRKYRNVK